MKTFEVGDQIALFYEQDGSFDPVKAVATAENISADGKSATFTFELVNPESGSEISLCYPAAFMDNPSGELRPALTQDGTLNGSVKANDVGFAMSNLVGTDLPASISLTNYFAVVAFTLKDGKGTAETTDDVDVTSTITEMTIELPDYSRTYTITREAAAGPIYVVLNQTDDTDAINITATGGGKTYTKSYTKGYTKDNFYQQGLLMTKGPAAVAHALSAAVVGDVVGSDGHSYNGTEYNNLPTGVTAVAKVCYVSGDGHGLALALENEGWMDWSTAKTTCEAHTPAVTGGTWQLPSRDDWNNMITAAGSYTALRDGFSSFGGTNMNANIYWSSTDAGTLYSMQFKYGYNFLNEEGSWGNFNSTSSQYTRACLAF